MATHKLHHVDSSVGERRLRIIYDWLDNGNNKKALQEAEKVLKKQPNFHCAKVLKALALLRLGREKESNELLESVKQQTPCDESTLQAMTICYRETHKPESICEIYEAATKLDPTNEDLMTHLFMAYVRTGNFKRQQRTAMLLYKTRPKNPYYFWAVMSIVMQAYEGDSNLSRSLVLPLAERMVKKFVDEDKIEAEQEVQLYIMILEMQNKYEEVLRLLNGPLGAKLISPSKASDKRIQALLRLKKCVQVNICLKRHLKQNLSQWSFYKDYLDSAFVLYDKANLSDPKEEEDLTENLLNEEEKNETADTSPSACWKFFQELQEMNIKSERAVRGPLLAPLELVKRLRTRGEQIDSVQGDILPLFIDYFTFFGSKPCCLADLRPYLNIIIQENRSSEFVKKLENIVDLEKDVMPKSESHMRKHQSLEQISRYLGLHNQLSEEEKNAKLVYYGRIFQHGRQFNPNSLTTELGCNDCYALLSAHLLYDIWLSTGKITPLLEALTLLESSLLQSPSNFHYKLLLIRLYHQLGAGSAAHTAYESLDIKHVQLDSLGWLHGSQLTSTGQIQRFYQVADVTLRLFHATNKDSLDHLTFSYKYGSFAKIHELVAFRDRLSSSHLLSMLTIDRHLYDLLIRTGSKQQAYKVYWGIDLEPWLSRNWSHDSLSDNRDLTVFVNWTNHDDHLTRVSSFEDDFCYLELRTWILRYCIALIDIDKFTNINWNTEKNISTSSTAPIQNGSEIPNDDSNKSSNLSYSSILKRLSSEISTILEKINSTPRYNVYQELISAPLDNRLSSMIEMNWISAALQLIKLFIQIQTNKEKNSNSKDEVEEKPILLAGGVISYAAQMIKEKQNRNNFKDGLVYVRNTFRAILNAIEMLGLVCLTLSYLTPTPISNNCSTCSHDDSLPSGNSVSNRTNASNRKQKQRKHLQNKKSQGISDTQNSISTSSTNNASSPLSSNVTFSSNPIQYIQQVIMESAQELETALNDWEEKNVYYQPQEINIPEEELSSILKYLSIDESTSLPTNVTPLINHSTSTASSKTSNNNLPSTVSQTITPQVILAKLRSSHFSSILELQDLLATKIKHLANLGFVLDQDKSQNCKSKMIQ